ncbi:MYB-related transcription factor [Chloropicon primus]|uniref:MYB-related transcription factor n=1 Tax=Chloropicon primus TaxID=1764295 RepID=A0A5B8MPB5_9CHLO|nr:MYB-related transcription factor [Chloropicon primus]UPR01105.1 MYB-related transcription factor [Chloropicon primus]|eukprot:QDZ21884.1 MYB-related transcription factor [Chloropicon primus]
MDVGVKREIDQSAGDANGQQLKRPRSQREPKKSFEKLVAVKEEPETEPSKEDELDEQGMSLFMDFVQAAASQKKSPVPAQGGPAAHNGLLSSNLKKIAPKTGKAGVRANVTVKSGASTSKGSRPWTPAEEHDLMKLVEIYGNKRWSYIAQLIHGRTGKQCRERWLNHLRPNIKKDEWTAEEERILAEGHAKLGTRWSSLAKLLPGRTENSIKNHWNATLRCKGRLRASKGSSRGNKPGVLKEYMDSLQRGLTAEKAVEIACFAEKLSTALAKEQPKKPLGNEEPGQYDLTNVVRQEVSGMVALNANDSREQLLDTEARLQEQRKKAMKSTENIYLTKRHMPHIDEWSFQYSDLGKNDWAWYWKLHNHRANVKIFERNFDPAKDFKWPHQEENLKETEDAVSYTAVGDFDKGISTSQYNSRALQCVLSACVFVVQRNDDVRVNVSIFLSKNEKEHDTLLVTVLSGGIGKTTGLQEMLRQIKTVLTLTSSYDAGSNPVKAPLSKKEVQKIAESNGKVPIQKLPGTKSQSVAKQNGTQTGTPGNAPASASGPAAGQAQPEDAKKQDGGSDSETISEGA